MGVPRYMSVQSLPGTMRLCSPQAAAALVRSGDKIAISANANTPRSFLEALFTRAEQLEHVEIMHMRLVGAFPRATPELARHIRFNPLLVPEALQTGVAAGYVDYTPAHFHQISDLFAPGRSSNLPTLIFVRNSLAPHGHGIYLCKGRKTLAQTSDIQGNTGR